MTIPTLWSRPRGGAGSGPDHRAHWGPRSTQQHPSLTLVGRRVQLAADRRTLSSGPHPGAPHRSWAETE